MAVFDEEVCGLCPDFCQMLAGKTLAERDQVPWRTFQADFSPNECPSEVFLFGEEAEPGVAVGGDMQVSRASMSVFERELLVANDDGHFSLGAAGKREAKRPQEFVRLA